MAWYDELGFKENPLDSRPNPDLVGLEKEEKRLMNHIKKNEICFLNGLTGAGKTSLLTKIQKQMKGYKFIYLDAQDLPKDFNLEEEIQNKKGFFDKIFLRKYPGKKPVLIIDEFQSTDPNLVMQARAKWENPSKRKIKSIVIAQISKYLKNVSPSFKERLGSRIIELPTLDEDEMREMLRRRLQRKKTSYVDKISDKAQNFLIKRAGGNPRRLLEYTDLLFDFHHRKFDKINPIHKEDYEISYHGAKEILAVRDIIVDGFSERKVKKSRNGKSFDSMFSREEQRYLMYLMLPRTLNDIAKKFNISKYTVQKKLVPLREKKAVLNVGKKGRCKLWQITPETKRLSVKV